MPLSLEDDDELPVLIIDTGTGRIKSGLSDKDAPDCIFPTCVGIPHGMKMRHGEWTGKEKFLGMDTDRETMKEPGMLSLLELHHPMEHGIIRNWEQMKDLWEYTINNVQGPLHAEGQIGVTVDVTDERDVKGVHLTEPPCNPRKNRERTIEMWFEQFKTPRLWISTQAVLCLQATGRSTGVVFDCGAGVSHAVPIFENYVFPHATQRNNLGGHDLTRYMCELLRESDVDLVTTAERDIGRMIKEQTCYVSENFQEEIDNFVGKEKMFTMPDGQVVPVYDQQIRVPEALFNPAEMGYYEMPGVHELVRNTVFRCDPNMHNALLSNVILSGGSTQFQGFMERLQAELAAIMPGSADVKVIGGMPSVDAHYTTVWMGAQLRSNRTAMEWLYLDGNNPEGKQGYGDFGENGAVRLAAMLPPVG
jgi:actin